MRSPYVHTWISCAMPQPGIGSSDRGRDFAQADATNTEGGAPSSGSTKRRLSQDGKRVRRTAETLGLPLEGSRPAAIVTGTRQRPVP